MCACVCLIANFLPPKQTKKISEFRDFKRLASISSPFKK